MNSFFWVSKFLIVIVLGLLFMGGESKGQTVIISGSVMDSTIDKPLQGAVLTLKGKKDVAVTDNNGEFSFAIIRGVSTIKCSYLGYTLAEKQLNLVHDTSFTFYLIPFSREMKEVTVIASGSDKNIRSVQGGIISLNRKEVTSLPVMLGESDFFKALQLLPGIQNSGEGNAAINVRGGGNDQNLILLDGAVVYNPTHLMGFYSIFNTDVIRDVTLIKSGIPAEYGNRISSVMNFTSRFEVPSKVSVFGNLGVISAHMGVTAPLPHEKGAVFIATRTTYLNLLLSGMRKIKLIKNNSILNKSGYDFYDLNGGLFLNVGHNDKLYISVYHGQDDFNLTSNIIGLQSSMDWGNGIASITWNHMFNNHFSMENRMIGSLYDYKMSFTQNQYLFNLSSSIQDIGFKNKFNYFTEKHKFKAGIEFVHHRIAPNSSTLATDSLQISQPERFKFSSFESSLFISDEIRISDRLSIVTGLRGNSFIPVGPYVSYQYDSGGNVIDSMVYPSGKIITTYWGLEPRFVFRYLLRDNESLKFSFNYDNQYLHLVNASSVTFPTDFWIPSTKIIQPQRGFQLSGGYYRNIFQGAVDVTAELYFKTASHQSEFNNSIVHVFDNTPTDENLIFGKGRSYGCELLIKKTIGKFTGWIGYTLSKSEKRFSAIGNGKWFAAKYDRTHDFSCVFNYTLSERWQFSSVFVYATGSAYTPVIGRYFMENNIMNQYGSYNSARMPDYHRLDLSATYIITKSETKDSRIIFSIYNVYNRQNPFFIYPQAKGQFFPLSLTVTPKEVSIFPILPSVSWQFLF